MPEPTISLAAPFSPLVPGGVVPGDWYPGQIPGNIQVGQGCAIDSSFCFKHYFATGECGLQVGEGVTFWRTSLAVEKAGKIIIGDHCYVSSASLVCAELIVIGDRVLVSGGVTIADSDFHPIAPMQRLADTIALSPIGDRTQRPRVESRPVFIEDDVWIGVNATILKGVRIGAGSVVEPGAVVTHNVPAGVRVAGNPARLVGEVLP